MNKLLFTFGLLSLVSAESVTTKSAFGNQDMYAESTIVQQGYAYPGIGRQGFGASSIGYARAASPVYGSVEKFPAFAGGFEATQGGGFYPRGIKYPYEGVEPEKFAYGGIEPKYGGFVTPIVKYPIYEFKPKAGVGFGYGGPIYTGGAELGDVGIGYGGAVLGYGGAGLGGGEYINKNTYGGGKKELKDSHYENLHGKKGEEFEEGQEGFNKGQAAVKEIKKDQAHYSNEQGDKKLAEEAKEYGGGHHYSQEGKNGEEKILKKGHRKGHVVKGFKKSHHKDESGRTEEFYDEEHDEGEQGAFNGQSGTFGENESSSFKGAHEDGEFKAKQGKKEGHYDTEHIVDHNNGDGGQYSAKKYGGSGSVYGVNNGVDEQSLLGHQENKKFIKHHPGHVPFFPYYK